MCVCVCVCVYMCVCVYIYIYMYRLPLWLSNKESACNAGDCLDCRRHQFNPWVRKIPWRRNWKPIPVFLPGKSHGQRSLADYNPWGRKSQMQLND